MTILQHLQAESQKEFEDLSNPRQSQPEVILDSYVKQLTSRHPKAISMFLKKFYKNSHFNPIPHLNGEERQKKR
jgi:hypothetical protein